MASKIEENTPDRYKNDRVSVVVTRKPHCIVEYKVEAGRLICLEAYKKAAKSIGKDVSISGFRKGKAPSEIIQKRYPHDLDKRWQEEIANASYQQAAQLASIPIINQEATITFKMESHSRDKAKLTLSFETFPSIPSIDPAQCVLQEVERVEVTKEKIDEMVRQTQMFFGKWEKDKDRAIKEGDFLLLDVDIIEDDPPRSLFANTRFEVTDRAMAQWMKKLIIGKKPGEIIEGISEADPSLTEEEKKEYPPKKVRVTIKNLEKVKLPELDDAFAKQVGVETVTELKEKIKQLLNKKADETVLQKQREQVTQFLLSQYFELPKSVIDQETKFRLEQMGKDPNFKAKWDRSGEAERSNIIEETKEQAEKAVRIFYLCRKIAADQKMSVNPKDVPEAPSDQISALLFPSAERHDSRLPDVKQAEIYSRILLEKTEDWIITHCRRSTGKKKQTTKAEEAASKKETAQATEKKSAPKKKTSPSVKKKGTQAKRSANTGVKKTPAKKKNPSSKEKKEVKKN